MEQKGMNLPNIIFTVLCVLFGNALYAFTVAAFIIPHDIPMGGITGIGILLNKFFPFIEVSIFVLMCNIVLLIVGLIILGKKLFFTTLASSVLYPIFLNVLQRLEGIDRLTDNTLLASLFAGCLMGISLGLVMRVGSSTGGMDIVNLLIHHWTNFNLAIIVYACDLVVIAAQAFVVTPEKLLMGILVLVLESILLEKTMIAGKSKIQLYIVSSEYEKIKECLLSKIEVGVTLSSIETGFLENQTKAVLCVLSNRKVHGAVEAVKEIDPHAFITISQINEVQGRGFSEKRIYLEKEEE